MTNRLMPYWPVFVLISAIVLFCDYLYIRYTTPLYAATATLIIKDEKKGNDDSKLMESLNMINNKKIIENEIEVLKSRLLMSQVVSTLHLYAQMYKMGQLKNSSAYTSSPVCLEVKEPENIIDTNHIRFTYFPHTGQVKINQQTTMAIGQWTPSKMGIIRFVKNKHYIPGKTTGTFYASLRQPKKVVNEILNHLSVNAANKLSSVINLTYKDENAQKAEDILNQLLQVYDNSSINEKNNLAKNTLQFVEERMNIVAKDLDSIEQNVQQYKALGGASDIGTEGQLYLQNVSSNDQRLGEINVQLAVLNQVNQRIKDGNKIHATPSTFGITDPTLSKMLLDLNDKELEYEKLKKTVAENNPLLVSIKDQINKIKPAIAENVSNQIANLETSKHNISTANTQYNSLLSRIPQKEKRLLEMSRDENIKKGIYAFLLEKREESELSYASTISDSRVINQAQSSAFPVSPNKPIIYLGSLLLSMLTTGLIIGSKDFFSNKILDRNQIGSLTRLPVIGEIALADQRGHLQIEKGKRSYLSETFKKINLSLAVLGIHKIQHTILVTSSIPGEGKSFVTVNLAMLNALMGKKVLMMDWDIHQAGLTACFSNSQKSPGMTEYLDGEASLGEIIHPVPDYSNLFIIPTRQQSTNEWMDSDKINTLMHYVQSQFEVILLDTAPIESMSDAFELSTHCDGTLFIVRQDYTPAALIKQLDQKMTINPLPDIKIIFNGVKQPGFTKHKYGYGYGYTDIRKAKKGVYI